MGPQEFGDGDLLLGPLHTLKMSEMSPLHPARKIEYEDGEGVMFTLDGDTTKLYTGVIKGKATSHIIDLWIVEVDKPNDLVWPYSCITVQHTFIKRIDDDGAFLSERKRVVGG